MQCNLAGVRDSEGGIPNGFRGFREKRRGAISEEGSVEMVSGIESLGSSRLGDAWDRDAKGRERKIISVVVRWQSVEGGGQVMRRRRENWRRIAGKREMDGWIVGGSGRCDGNSRSWGLNFRREEEDLVSPQKGREKGCVVRKSGLRRRVEGQSGRGGAMGSVRGVEDGKMDTEIRRR